MTLTVLVTLLGCFVIMLIFRIYQEFLSRCSEVRAMELATQERLCLAAEETKRFEMVLKSVAEQQQRARP